MFQRLAGLPPYGPTAKLIPDGWGHGAREGMVVEFQRSDGTGWVGNFEPGLGGLDDAILHPNGVDTLVASSGQLWAVNAMGEAVHRIAPAVFSVWTLEGPRRLLFSNQDLAFLCVGHQGVIWWTRRISWDGFQKVRVDKNVLVGEAWSPLDDGWHAFQVNLEDGSVVGGSYNGPEMTFGGGEGE